jgi:hypothetical protein
MSLVKNTWDTAPRFVLSVLFLHRKTAAGNLLPSRLVVKTTAYRDVSDPATVPQVRRNLASHQAEQYLSA